MDNAAGKALRVLVEVYLGGGQGILAGAYLGDGQGILAESYLEGEQWIAPPTSSLLPPVSMSSPAICEADEL